MTDLESLIRQYVKLGRASAKGFEACVCQACNDYKERGGFNFNDGVTYNCFNCGAHFGIKFGNASKDALGILASFGIPESDVKLLLAKDRLDNLGKPQVGSNNIIKAHVAQQPTIELPPDSFPLNELAEDNPWVQVANEYIKSRGFKPVQLKVYISFAPKFEGRLILPVYDYTNTRLVYYQARAMDESIEPRFKNPSTGKETAIFNEAALHEAGYNHIYVTEGIFDALSCGNGYGPAVAPLGSSLNEQVLFKLRRASLRGKKLIFVIDKNENGEKMALHALAEGWSIVLMPDNIADANECRTELGSLYLSAWLASNQLTGVQAQLAIKMKCNGNKR